MRLYWHTFDDERGKVVQHFHPQLPGRDHRAEGDGEGLTLEFDHAARTWTVRDGSLGILLRGQGTPAATVAEAVAARAARLQTA